MRCWGSTVKAAGGVGKTISFSLPAGKNLVPGGVSGGLRRDHLARRGSDLLGRGVGPGAVSVPAVAGRGSMCEKLQCSAFLQGFRKMDLVLEPFPGPEGQRKCGAQQKALSCMGMGSLLPARGRDVTP